VSVSVSLKKSANVTCSCVEKLLVHKQELCTSYNRGGGMGERERERKRKRKRERERKREYTHTHKHTHAHTYHTTYEVS
jgi:hypothetical protein